MSDPATQLIVPATTKVVSFVAESFAPYVLKPVLNFLGQKDNKLFERFILSKKELIQQAHYEFESQKNIQGAWRILLEIGKEKSNPTDALKNYEEAKRKYEKVLIEIKYSDKKLRRDDWINTIHGFLLCREQIAMLRDERCLSTYVVRWKEDLTFAMACAIECDEGKWLSKALKEQSFKDKLVELFENINSNANDAAKCFNNDRPDLQVCLFTEFLRSQIPLPKSVNRFHFQQLLDLAGIPATYELLTKAAGGMEVVAEPIPNASVPQHQPLPGGPEAGVPQHQPLPGGPEAGVPQHQPLPGGPEAGVPQHQPLPGGPEAGVPQHQPLPGGNEPERQGNLLPMPMMDFRFEYLIIVIICIFAQLLITLFARYVFS